MNAETAGSGKRVIYSGRVQGVGFRFTTHGIARRFDVRGDVRNRSDGTVELRVAGRASEIDAFLNAVADRFEGNIDSVDIEAFNRFDQLPDGFEVRR